MSWRRDEDLTRAACINFQLPFANLAKHSIPRDILDLVPARVAHSRRVVPVAIKGERLILATSAEVESTRDVLSFDDFEGATQRVFDAAIDLRRVCEPALATPLELDRVLREAYGKPG